MSVLETILVIDAEFVFDFMHDKNKRISVIPQIELK